MAVIIKGLKDKLLKVQIIHPVHQVMHLLKFKLKQLPRYRSLLFSTGVFKSFHAPPICFQSASSTEKKLSLSHTHFNIAHTTACRQWVGLTGKTGLAATQ